MEDVLAVYTRPYDPDRPLVCLDETSKQLIAETRMPIPMKPGRAVRVDYEYERNGTANLFMLFAPLETTQGGSMAPRVREIILKMDQRKIVLEIGQSANSPLSQRVG